MKIQWYWIFGIGILCGLLIAYSLRPDKVDVSAYEKEIAELQEAIKIRNSELNKLLNQKDILKNELDSTKANYVELLAHQIKPVIVDSLQKQEISKVDKRYALDIKSQTQSAAASIYGNLAFDELIITDERRAINQKVISNQSGVIIYKDSIIAELIEVGVLTEQNAKKKGLDGFFKGFAVGFPTALLLLLLLL